MNIQQLIAFLYARNKQLKREITILLSVAWFLYSWDSNNNNVMLQVEECSITLKNVGCGQTA